MHSRLFALGVALALTGVLVTFSRVPTFDATRSKTERTVRHRRSGAQRLTVKVNEDTLPTLPSPDEGEWKKHAEGYYLPDPETLIYGNGKYRNTLGWAEAMLKPLPKQRTELNLEEMGRKPSVLVIGSGPAGLAMLRALSQLDARDDGEHPVDFECYDRYVLQRIDFM